MGLLKLVLAGRGPARCLGGAATILWALALLLVAPSDSHAQRAVPPRIQAEILLRVLEGDGASATRYGRSARIGLVFRAGDWSSLNARAIEAFGALSGRHLAGRPIEVLQRAVSDPDELVAWLGEERIDILWVSEGLADQVVPVAEWCRKQGVICVGTTESAVAAGLALGVVPQGNKPRLMLNVGAAEAVGLRLSTELLKTAKTIN